MKFAYWSREVAGWALILGGLYAFLSAYNLLLNKRIFEAGPVVFIGFIVFRGGIHILKVAVAAQASRMLPETSQPGARRIARDIAASRTNASQCRAARTEARSRRGRAGLSRGRDDSFRRAALSSSTRSERSFPPSHPHRLSTPKLLTDRD